MEISKIKYGGSYIDVIFTGPCYFFFSSFCGYIAIAERTEESIEKAGSGWQEFVIYSGNKRMPDGIEKDWFELAEKFIRRQECKFVKTKVNFIEKIADLDKCHVTVSYEL